MIPNQCEGQGNEMFGLPDEDTATGFGEFCPSDVPVIESEPFEFRGRGTASRFRATTSSWFSPERLNDCNTASERAISSQVFSVSPNDCSIAPKRTTSSWVSPERPNDCSIVPVTTTRSWDSSERPNDYNIISAPSGIEPNIEYQLATSPAILSDSANELLKYRCPRPHRRREINGFKRNEFRGGDTAFEFVEVPNAVPVTESEQPVFCGGDTAFEFAKLSNKLLNAVLVIESEQLVFCGWDTAFEFAELSNKLLNAVLVTESEQLVFCGGDTAFEFAKLSNKLSNAVPVTESEQPVFCGGDTAFEFVKLSNAVPVTTTSSWDPPAILSGSANELSKYRCPRPHRRREINSFKRKDHPTQHIRNYRHIEPESPSVGMVYACSHSGCPDYRKEKSREESHGEDHDYPFTTKAQLTKHLKKVHNESEFPRSVPYCDKIGGQGFMCERDLFKHVNAKHPKAPANSQLPATSGEDERGYVTPTDSDSPLTSIATLSGGRNKPEDQYDFSLLNRPQLASDNEALAILPWSGAALDSGHFVDRGRSGSTDDNGHVMVLLAKHKILASLMREVYSILGYNPTETPGQSPSDAGEINARPSSYQKDAEHGRSQNKGGKGKKRVRDRASQPPDEDENDGRKKRSRGEPDHLVDGDGRLYACPFFKYDSRKYNCNSSTVKKYRTCAGPGWSNIARLK
jgi:hypothetical protein